MKRKKSSLIFLFVSVVCVGSMESLIVEASTTPANEQLWTEALVPAAPMTEEMILQLSNPDIACNKCCCDCCECCDKCIECCVSYEVEDDESRGL